MRCEDLGWTGQADYSSPSPSPGHSVRKLQGPSGAQVVIFGAHLCQNQEQISLKELGERACLSHPVDSCRCLPPWETGAEEYPSYWKWACPSHWGWGTRSLLEPRISDRATDICYSTCHPWQLLLLYKSHLRVLRPPGTPTTNMWDQD